MAQDDDFRVRPGRIRSSKSQRAKPFIAQALAAAQRAGGGISRNGTIKQPRSSHFGRGRVASVRANRLLTGHSRRVTIQARVVRHTARSAPLTAHLAYLRREGVTRDGEKARLFGPETENADPKAFAERCRDDRHHFRFIVSPEDAADLADLKGYARDLVAQIEMDLGTQLDWVAVDHWNTQHPHVHIIVRGVADDGRDLVIARDYIKEGMRARAQDLVTQELGPRTDLDIRHALERQVDADYWTQLDRQLVRDADRHGVIDLAPVADQQPDDVHALKVGRLRRLETLGLAHPVGAGQWMMDETAEATLRELGERGDIIKRIHRGLTARGIGRGTTSYVLAGESLDDPIIGRLVDCGLDDELKGTAYAVVDGVDGRTHHIRLPDLDAAGDSAPGSIVELRKFDDARGRRRVALAVRSDLSIEAQVLALSITRVIEHRRWRRLTSEGPIIAHINPTSPDIAFAQRQARDKPRTRTLVSTWRPGPRSCWSGPPDFRGAGDADFSISGPLDSVLHQPHVCYCPTERKGVPLMANLAPVSVRISAQERELLEAAAERSRTNLSDFIRRKAVEAAEIDLVHQNIVIIPAADWEKFESWVDSPAKDVPALRDLAKVTPAWRG